jgi:hypothetical protein
LKNFPQRWSTTIEAIIVLPAPGMPEQNNVCFPCVSHSRN